MTRFASLLALAALSACIPMAQIQQQQQQHIARMCQDPNYAYESGYNSGLERRRLDTTWVDTSCMPAWRAQIRQSYESGYENGMQHAPIVVNGMGGGGRARGAVYVTQPSCTFSSDCDEGQSCRHDSASGQNVCMGGGYAGDACWFSSDCVSNDCSSNRCR
jgi:hypothetical protein